MSNISIYAKKEVSLDEVGDKGRDMLDYLRTHASKTKKTKERAKVDKVTGFILRDDQGIAIMEEYEVPYVQPNRRRMTGVPAHWFYRFAQFMDKADEDDVARYKAIVGCQRFDINQGLAAHEALEFALNPEIRPATWKECEEMRTVSFRMLAQYKGDQVTKIILKKMIELFLTKFGKRSDIEPHQVTQLAVDLLQDFPGMTLAQAKMILNLAAKQDIATKRTFNVDYSTIYGLFKEMDADYKAWGTKENARQHWLNTRDGFERDQSGTARQMLGEFFDRVASRYEGDDADQAKVKAYNDKLQTDLNATVGSNQ